MDDVGYKYTASYAKIVKESLNGAIPEMFDRINRYKSEYGVELEWPLHDLRELAWPKELDENELKFKRGQRIKHRMDPGKPLTECEVLGLVWEDATGKKNLCSILSTMRGTTLSRERSHLWPRRSSCIVKPSLSLMRMAKSIELRFRTSTISSFVEVKEVFSPNLA